MHLHCSNCGKPSTKRIEVPVGEGMPSNVDEFLEAIEDNPPPFMCLYCESIVGTLVSVTVDKQLGDDGRAADEYRRTA